MSRLQNAGVTSANVAATKISELGNESTVATVYDNPDLTFGLESLDAQCDLEAILTRVDPTTVTPGQAFDFRNAQPIDIVAPWKSAYGTHVAINGIAVPYLYTEQVTYRAGVRANATTQVTLRGDSEYFCQKTPYYQRFNASG